MASNSMKGSYSPTAEEASALAAFHTKAKTKKPAPGIKLKPTVDGKQIPAIDHPDTATGWTLLAETLNITDESFLFGLADQLVQVGSKGELSDDNEINFLLAAVRGIAPRDNLENMLALQMAATHNLVMIFAKRLGQAETIQQQDAAEKAFNKLARTFAAQVECLKKYRSNGQQVVTVQHVNVNDGGQAVIGQVSVGGGANKKTEKTPCKAN